MHISDSTVSLQAAHMPISGPASYRAHADMPQSVPQCVLDILTVSIVQHVYIVFAPIPNFWGANQRYLHLCMPISGPPPHEACGDLQVAAVICFSNTI
jgi:hypothetical protein